MHVRRIFGTQGQRITRSCSTLLCFRLCISANGITLGADIYTAVPAHALAVISPAKRSSLPESCHVRASGAAGGNARSSRVITDKHHRPEAQRQASRRRQFIEVSREQRNIDTQEGQSASADKQLIPVPVLRATVVERMDVSTMVPLRRNPVRRRQVAGVLKADNHDHDRDVQHPVNERNINLP